ncbi:unnamed protein product [Paramecium sonneborni]|uniref:Uncharacterized protein n=1 Tax=Paramecium sonneborni TaxID=65129 RepID=A0A8S1QSI4_9CILI|nr:unnamed protein product [Paramecium sonneborni]
MKNNSQQKESTQQLKEIIHRLQQREASQRIEIAKLKILLVERDQEFKLVADQLQELRRIQQRDNQYILKIDNYVANLKQKLQKANIKIESFESKFSSSRVKQNYPLDDSFNGYDSFHTDNSTISTNKKQILKQKSNRFNLPYSVKKPKLIQKPIKVQLPYPNTSFTENQEILENNTLLKPSPLQEQILHRILDDEEFINNFTTQYGQMQTDLFSYQKSQTQPISFACNSRQSNYNFANSEKKQNHNSKLQKHTNRQYHSISIDEKENNSKYFN